MALDAPPASNSEERTFQIREWSRGYRVLNGVLLTLPIARHDSVRAGSVGTVLVRPRRSGDVVDCVKLARLTHVADDYPKCWPQDPEAFIVSPRELGAWVAEYDGVVVGHVALHTPADDPTFDQVRLATGRDTAAIAVVARLFSSPDARGRGIGWALLTGAEQAAHAVGRLPILDVGKALTAAVALYDRAGWRRVGEFTFYLRGESLDMWVDVGPAPA